MVNSISLAQLLAELTYLFMLLIILFTYISSTASVLHAVHLDILMYVGEGGGACVSTLILGVATDRFNNNGLDLRKRPIRRCSWD